MPHHIWDKMIEDKLSVHEMCFTPLQEKHPLEYTIWFLQCQLVAFFYEYVGVF